MFQALSQLDLLNKMRELGLLGFFMDQVPALLAFLKSCQPFQLDDAMMRAVAARAAAA